MSAALIFRSRRKAIAAFVFVFAHLAFGAVIPIAVDPQSLIDPQVPTWVGRGAEMPAGAPVATSSAIRMLTVEQQMNVATDELYSRYAIRVESEAGLQSAGQVSISYASLYQKLRWHYLRIWRAGEKRDVLKPESIQVLRQEQDAERFMYHGYVSAVVVLHDLRIGDVVEYAYTRTGSNPVFDGRFSLTLAAAAQSPVDRLYYRVIEPRNRTLHVGAVGKHTLQYHAEETAVGVEHIWTGRDIAKIETVGDAPSSEVQIPFIEMSEFASWQDVAAWGARLFDVPMDASKAVKEAIAAEVGNAQTPAEKANAILRFIQDDIRYLGIEFGQSSHRPEAPAEVLRRRFGDCKDKSLLLVACLRELGFTADIALVNSDLRGKIKSMLPSPLAFDHVIVRLSVPSSLRKRPSALADITPNRLTPMALVDATRQFAAEPALLTTPTTDELPTFGTSSDEVWLDATQTLQGGSLLDRNRGEFGAALLLTPGSDRTVTIHPLPDDFNAVHATESYRATDTAKPGMLDIETSYHGGTADFYRYAHRHTDPDQNLRELTAYLTRFYPKIRAAGAQAWTDDRVRNVIKVHSSFEVPELWTVDRDGKRRRLEVGAWAISERLVRPDTVERTAALALPHPQDVTEDIEIALPKVWPWTPEHRVIDDPTFHFKATTDEAGSVIHATYHWRTKSNAVAADRVPEWTRKMAQVRSSLDLSLQQNIRLAAEMSRDGIVVPLLLSAIGGVIAAVVVSLVLLRTGSAGNGEPPVLPNQELVGIGGWLIVLAIGVTLRPLLLLRGFWDTFRLIWAHRVWVSRTDIESVSYSPAFALLVSAEVACAALFFIWSLVIVYQFFAKKRSLPRLYVTYLVVVTSWAIGRAVWLSNTDLATPATMTAETMSAVQFFIYTAIWCPYLLKSRRVKNTFVN